MAGKTLKRDEVQISAFVSSETKKEVDEYTRATGIKKGRVIEAALLHHFRVLREIPMDMIISPSLVVSREVGERVMELIRNAPSPTKALRDLMRGD